MTDNIFSNNNKPASFPGPLCTKWYSTSYRQISGLKSLSRVIVCYNDLIALEFDRHLGSAAVEEPVKFRRDEKSLNPNLSASRLHEILL